MPNSQAFPAPEHVERGPHSDESPIKAWIFFVHAGRKSVRETGGPGEGVELFL